MENNNYLKEKYSNIIKGDMSIISSLDFCNRISEITVELLNKSQLDKIDLENIDLIIKISNIAYNNTSLDVLPLDDGLYDQILERYKMYNPNYQIGAQPIIFDEKPQNEFNDKIVICYHMTKEERESKLFINDILDQWNYGDPRYKHLVYRVQDPITKRIINTKHKYPELVGTLDKCKFVLNNDAIEKDVFDKQSVAVFERDFIQKHIANGIITPNETFEMIGELKYDGISVEADVYGDTIISARSRGDTSEDIATDLTPILGGYRFPNAKNVPKDITFGIKFEAVITKKDLELMSIQRNRSYRNCRNAIIGLFGSSDAYLYKDYITLVPLATSLDINRLDELEFLNKYYSSGEYNRFVLFRGDYISILYQVKQFTESAETVRKMLPYLIDGVVISYIDPNIIEKLGRVNSVNKYSMAIKFNPKKVRTLFLGYTYSIGKTGDVIPMVHFKPCEFMGTIHNKQTLHSYSRFNELNLRIGDQVDIEYRNDVLTYVTKPNTESNRNNNREPEKFLEICPYCGSKIVISDSGKSAKCPNINCSERQIMRMIDMIDRLGFKDFSEETIRTLNIKSLKELLSLSHEQLSILGPINSQSFLSYINYLKSNPIEDYKIMSSLGYDGIATEKWKVILKQYSIRELLSMTNDELYHNLISINSIGEKIIQNIILYNNLYREDLEFIIHNLIIIDYKGLKDKPRVVITGFRDKEFIDLINSAGYDADESYTLTKKTYCLITSDINLNSTKIQKAKKYGIPILTKQEFIINNGIKI